MDYIHISLNVSEECINLVDTYGMICIKCNACGRFDKKTQKECALKMYKRHLKEKENFDGWIEGLEEIQRKNNQSSIEYLKNKIKEIENELLGENK